MNLDEGPQEIGPIGLAGHLIQRTIREAEAEGVVWGIGSVGGSGTTALATNRARIVAEARAFLRGAGLDDWCLACGADPAVIRTALERAYPWMREGEG